MEQQLQELQQRVLAQLKDVQSSEEVEKLRVSVLGRKGELTGMLRLLGTLSKEERPAAGQKVNAVREVLSQAMDEAEATFARAELQRRLEAEAIDVTMPGEAPHRGTLHPLTLVLGEVRDIFTTMGFEVMEGPEIELDHINFEMLNIPKDHPARDMQDTFYINENVVMRTHTSPVQARAMLSRKPPIRMICPGRVFRSDDVDATHSPVFHQVEGLVIDKNITFGQLKGILDDFMKRFFGPHTQTRFRPGYFPFTEPSAEVDATCTACGGKGCRVCKGTGWIEVLGCGMVHPNVLRYGGIDPEVYTGFAFGLGIDRFANIKYNITDIRLLLEGDARFLAQF